MKTVTASQMRKLDEKAIHTYGIPSIVLMENAGAACAGYIQLFYKSKKAPILIFSGKGNNGGDGFVIARHLYNQGFNPTVFFFQKPSEMKPDPLVNFKILKKMKIKLVDCSGRVPLPQIRQKLKSAQVIVDALFGTGLSKPLRNPFDQVVDLINQSKKPVVAVDIPSGLHADTGDVMGVAVRAKCTVTLGLPKKGFCRTKAKNYTGEVMVADISIPRELLC